MIIKKILIFIFIFLLSLAAFSFGVFSYIVNNHVIDFSILEFNNAKPSILLDDQGKEWARFELDKRTFTSYEKFPKHLIQAFIAAEDREFFQHAGISYKGILRSIFINLKSGKKVQGASTITQQLIRLLFFDTKKTFKRKIKEQIFAILVEKQFSKEQILELYLNHIYFGCGIYGVEAAAQRFFGKSVQEISIAESAVLAAIVKSPAHYCPLINLDDSKKRRNLILSIMRDLKIINFEQFKVEASQELNVEKNFYKGFASHLKENIRILLENKIGKEKLYCAGLKIQTTINARLQTIAEFEFKRQFKKLRKELDKDVDGGLICIDAKSGEIKAIIGGYDFNNSKYNRALQARRQMGSTFKPIVYTAALQKGFNFFDTEIDEPISLQIGKNKWSPNNNTRLFEGKMTLAKALSFSNNTIAVKTLLKVGVEDIIKLAKKFRFSTDFKPYPSLALGCIDINLKESVGAFNVFANNGVFVEPHFLKWIKDEFGTKIIKFDYQKEKIIESSINDQVAQVLSLSIKRYLNKLENKNFKCAAIGKTGTTNDSRTCWFCGSIPNLTTSIYIGCDDNRSLGDNIYAVRTVFPIWLAMHEKLKIDKENFSFDPSLKKINIDWISGQHSDELNNPNVVPLLVKS